MAIKDAKRAEDEANKPEMTQEELEAIVDKELDETIKRVERDKKKADKKEKAKEVKQDIRKKMSVIAASGLDNDEDLIMDQRTWAKLKAVEDAEDIQKYLPKRLDDSEDEENMDPTERKFRFLNDGVAKQIEEGDDSSDDISEDERVTRADRMASEIEDSIRQQKDYQMLKTKKQAKKDLKAKALVEQ